MLVHSLGTQESDNSTPDLCGERSWGSAMSRRPRESSKKRRFVGGLSARVPHRLSQDINVQSLVEARPLLL